MLQPEEPVLTYQYHREITTATLNIDRYLHMRVYLSVAQSDITELICDSLLQYRLYFSSHLFLDLTTVCKIQHKKLIQKLKLFSSKKLRSKQTNFPFHNKKIINTIVSQTSY